MSNPLEIVDNAYVALDHSTLLHLPTQKRITMDEGIKLGVVRMVEDIAAHIKTKTNEAIKRVAEMDREKVCGIVIGVIFKGDDHLMVDTSIVGLPHEVRGTIISLMQRADEMYGLNGDGDERPTGRPLH